MSRERTLVVSPDPGLVNQARGAIQVLGGRVVSSPAGEQALAEVAVRDIGLVVATVRLPGMSGYELCRALKEADDAMKVVLVHGAGDSVAVERAVEAGADAVIGRPFPGAHLASKLELLMGRGFFNGSSGAGDGVSDRSPESIIDPATGLFAVESDSVDVVISADDDWAESVVSAAIRPLDESFDDSLDSLHTGAIEAVENPDSTQELPELALETFDPAHPVSIPVDAGTTAHFRPLTNPEVEAVDDSDGDSDGDSDDDSAGRSASSRSLRAARRKTSLSRESGYNAADTSGFIPTQEDLSPDRSEVKEIVRGELAGLTAPGGKLAVAIERTVANAVAEALRSVLPALAHEAARIASEEDDSA